jgi:hypothetical protein
MLWWSSGSWGLWWLLVAVMGAFMVICMAVMVRMMMRHAMPCFRARRSERHEPERILALPAVTGKSGWTDRPIRIDGQPDAGWADNASQGVAAGPACLVRQSRTRVRH